MFYLYSLQVRKEVNKRITHIIGWSLRQAAQGRFPTEGLENETFQRGSFRSSLAGSRIAGGHRTLDIGNPKISTFWFLIYRCFNDL